MRRKATFDSVTAIYDEATFRKAYRIDCQTFYKLLNIVKITVHRNVDDDSPRTGRPAVEAAVRLGITFQKLAGGSYVDLMASFAVSKSTVYATFKATLAVLNEYLSFPSLPIDVFKLKRIAEDFSSSRKPGSSLSVCVGALDGIVLKIKEQDNDPNPATFDSWKQFNTIPIQALVDFNYRFHCFSALYICITHDSLAIVVSALGKFLSTSQLRFHYEDVGGCVQSAQRQWN